MYESFYGFSGKPFQLNPDPEFFFASRQHQRAMSFVEYGLHQSEGFIVVTGEVGAGKTTVIRNLLVGLDKGKVTTANLVSTQLDAEDMLRMVAAAFGVPTKGLAKSDILLSLEAHLAFQAEQGRRSLLIVDEAQNLTARAVEELRMLSNFQLGTHALLQSFLVGQPEFRHILQSPEMRQFRQRVIAACHIGPMAPDETRRYVEHRLRHVGWSDSPQFEAGAFEAIHAASEGIPRRINLLCDRLLLSGFIAGQRVITVDLVGEVADEIRDETMAPAEAEAAEDARGQPGPEPRPELAGPGPAGVAPGRNAGPNGRSLLDRELLEIKAELEREGRVDQATPGLARRFLDWMRQQSGDRGGHG